MHENSAAQCDESYKRDTYEMQWGPTGQAYSIFLGTGEEEDLTKQVSVSLCVEDQVVVYCAFHVDESTVRKIQKYTY